MSKTQNSSTGESEGSLGVGFSKVGSRILGELSIQKAFEKELKKRPNAPDHVVFLSRLDQFINDIIPSRGSEFVKLRHYGMIEAPLVILSVVGGSDIWAANQIAGHHPKMQIYRGDSASEASKHSFAVYWGKKVVDFAHECDGSFLFFVPSFALWKELVSANIDEFRKQGGNASEISELSRKFDLSEVEYRDWNLRLFKLILDKNLRASRGPIRMFVVLGEKGRDHA